MAEGRELSYRNGRLLLPRDLADRGPRELAEWLSGVPVGDRSRAFRALPLNVAAAAFLAMEPWARVGLLTGLNRQNIRYLGSIASDIFLLETLECAGEDVYAALLAELPDWRYQRIEEALEARRREAEERLSNVRSRGAQASRRRRFANLFGLLNKLQA